MISTEKLETILTKCEIIKSFVPLHESILSYYYCNEDYYVILINKSIKNDERLYRIVLAEEIGHYKTTIGDITPRKYMCYSKRLELDKMELLALKWATDFLVPTDKLIEVIESTVAVTFDELVDYFYVTEEFMMQKFKFMAKQKITWELDDKRCLCLHNFPTISIFERM
ncbi:ImmA/IrrE family metallo-endopeptidase [Tepidibacter aestuarii]|uniref:ImmA/IrrE family metallo-endopeptidase n=1 Tax=Tepidibacter aestuarii TaxID=2925782 RepID=UPI0020BE61F9|nr:ImmA/IrrE family metallo-endopeptidase [Tepidibacter aestuarii]CAH2213193.1 Peptidase [Tepidibacter aestuarii]